MRNAVAESRLSYRDAIPHDSRGEDERVAERRLRDLLARVKAARTLVSATGGLSETLARECLKAARFFVRLGITEKRL